VQPKSTPPGKGRQQLLSLAAREAILATVPHPGEPPLRLLFKLVVALKPICRDADEATPAFIEWCHHARQDPAELDWLFRGQWDHARHSKGDYATYIVEQANLMESALALKLYPRKPKLALLVKLCKVLSSEQHGGAFHLSQRFAAVAIGMTPRGAGKALKRLVESGVLVVDKPGRRGAIRLSGARFRPATTYRLVTRS
jgi:hypothetical protein